MVRFDNILQMILTEEFSSDYVAAVGVVQCRNKWLLGLARKTNDDRTNKWVFPGGHIEKNETPEKAAEREVYEETGIRCKAISKAFFLPSKPKIAFVHCRARQDQVLQQNDEFTAIGWFDTREMKGLKLYNNVLKLIERVKE